MYGEDVLRQMQANRSFTTASFPDEVHLLGSGLEYFKDSTSALYSFAGEISFLFPCNSSD